MNNLNIESGATPDILQYKVACRFSLGASFIDRKHWLNRYLGLSLCFPEKISVYGGLLLCRLILFLSFEEQFVSFSDLVLRQYSEFICFPRISDKNNERQDANSNEGVVYPSFSLCGHETIYGCLHERLNVRRRHKGVAVQLG